jgi:hypothetical protein
MIVFYTLIAGLVYPCYAAAFGIGYPIFRFVYAEGYKKHPWGRVWGAILMDACLLFNFCFAVSSVNNYGFDQTYKCIFFGILALMFSCFAIGFIMNSPNRISMFTAKFMSEFEDDHTAAFGKDAKLPVKEGYPDTGNGRFC